MAVNWSDLSAQNVVKMNYSLCNFFHNKFIITTETITTTTTTNTTTTTTTAAAAAAAAAAATTGYAVCLFLYRSISVHVAGI